MTLNSNDLGLLNEITIMLNLLIDDCELELDECDENMDINAKKDLEDYIMYLRSLSGGIYELLYRGYSITSTKH